MIIIVLLLFMVIISRSQIAKPNEFNMGYLDQSQTNVIKGIFVVLVLLGHSTQYVQMQGSLDEPYMYMRAHLGQMVVSMFLFYSGYGMLKSIIAKRYEYIRSFPVKRFLITFINFAVALLLYCGMNYCLNIHYDWKFLLLSFTGWVGIGNSNWYMFAIFCLYIIFYFSFYFTRWIKSNIALYMGMLFLSILSILLVYWEIRVGQSKWFYDTIILFALGGWFALFQDKIEDIWLKNDCIYLVGCAIMAVIYWLTFKNRGKGIELYSVWAIVFTLLVVIITMKIKIESNIFEWMGKHVFSIYILQRIPMTVISRLGFANGSRYTFVVLCLIITIAIAAVYDYFIAKFDRMILSCFLKENKKQPKKVVGN